MQRFQAEDAPIPALLSTIGEAASPLIVAT